jgi:hypothetical protein
LSAFALCHWDGSSGRGILARSLQS